MNLVDFVVAELYYYPARKVVIGKIIERRGSREITCEWHGERHAKVVQQHLPRKKINVEGKWESDRFIAGWKKDRFIAHRTEILGYASALDFICSHNLGKLYDHYILDHN